MPSWGPARRARPRQGTHRDQRRRGDRVGHRRSLSRSGNVQPVRWTGAFATVLVATSMLVGCGDDEPTSLGASTADAGSVSSGDVAEPELREELLAMLEADQQVRSDVDADWDAVDVPNQERRPEERRVGKEGCGTCRTR